MMLLSSGSHLPMAQVGVVGGMPWGAPSPYRRKPPGPAALSSCIYHCPGLFAKAAATSFTMWVVAGSCRWEGKGRQQGVTGCPSNANALGSCPIHLYEHTSPGKITFLCECNGFFVHLGALYIQVKLRLM